MARRGCRPTSLASEPVESDGVPTPRGFRPSHDLQLCAIVGWRDPAGEITIVQRGLQMTSIPQAPTRILVVEDEMKVANALREGLESERYEVAVEHTGEGAFFRLNTEAFEVILLDLMLPGRDGLQILRTLRARGDKTPVLVLTARDTLEDRVRGLDSGADDYLVKPFAFEEVLARIRALLRRGRAAEPLRPRIGDLELDLVTRKVTRGSQPVELTVREFELLEYLLRHQGQTVSRSTLARDVWKETARTTSLDNVIDVHIARLRRKVDLEHAVKLIHTIRGVGFMLREGEP
jgi:two-component system copper resistance phosphate regulon response regulator CusR